MTSITPDQCILIVDDDPVVTEALSMTLERPGRSIILCSDVESAEISLAQYPVTHLVCDVQFSGDFGFEGLHFLGRVRALAPHCRIVLITGFATDALRQAALGLGAAAVLAKPFDTADLDRLLDARAGATRPGNGDDRCPGRGDTVRFPSIDDILRGDELVAAFQPIRRISADGTRAFGFEALTRARGRWMQGGPAMLYDYAERRGRLAELNLFSMQMAIAAAAELPDESTLFLNVDPRAFDRTGLVPALDAACKRADLPMSRIVLEITERSGFTDEAAAARIFDALRARGIRFALDDHGSAYSHLSVINRIRPSFIKISQTFGTDFETDPTKVRIIKHVVDLARDFGCETILEGIESEMTAQAAAGLGIEFAQGFHFGRPNGAAHWLTHRVDQQAA